ncbi:hypothetical protein [Flaviflexus massiliensis]|uniref:hypothetical protein n=1 Tax=Flaviflexus massiliensis TaxID=1522309 RepID=UPI00097CF652|nr:hypothetical protein [Flaviflexus massiliensis]
MGRRTTVVVAGLSLVLAACSSVQQDSSDGHSETSEPASAVVLQEPDTVVISSTDPAEVSIRTSEAFFESSDGAIVTSEGSALTAASLAHTYHLPVLVEGEGTVAELDRLGVEWILTVDIQEDYQDVEAIPAGSPYAPATGTEAAQSKEEATGTGTENEKPERDDRVRIVGGDITVEALVDLGEGEAFIAPEKTDRNLDVDVQADSETDLLVLTDGQSPAAIGTARAAGADVMIAPADPRISPEIIERVAERDNVMGIFGTEVPDFEWQLRTAMTGVQLPGGGQTVFDHKRYIALYGAPTTPALGVLGEQDAPGTIARAEASAAEYDALTDDTVVPTLEIIVTVAAGSEGPDGNFSHEAPPEQFVELIEAAGEAGQYVVLDFQPGRTDFLTQVQQYEELLKYPHVGIALDPEWRLGPDEMPLTRIGHVEIAEVNEVVNYLAQFVHDRNLPQKLVILHQFQLQMIRDRDQLDLSNPEVALLIHADGQGSQGAKNATWANLHTDAPEGVMWGWKNFIDEDQPMLSPEETFAIEPMPHFVSYQ